MAGPPGLSGPVIGIAPDIDADRCVVSRAYAAAVAAAGGLPVILPPLPSLAGQYIRLCDGLILTGGNDPIMERWGIPTHPAATKVHPDRQAFDLALLEAVGPHGEKPVLGVCLGMQLMGLCAGGRLDQCIGNSLPTCEDHWGRKVHPVSGELGQGQVMSNHRQAIVDAGSMRVVAEAPDGVIEAIRDDDRAFYVGVQWHPERTDDESLGTGIIAQLVRAAVLRVETKGQRDRGT